MVKRLQFMFRYWKAKRKRQKKIWKVKNRESNMQMACKKKISLFIEKVTMTLLCLPSHPLTYSLTYLLTHLLTHLLTYSLTHLLTYSLTHLLTYSLTYSLTYLLTYSLTHSLTHSLRSIIHTIRARYSGGSFCIRMRRCGMWRLDASSGITTILRCHIGSVHTYYGDMVMYRCRRHGWSIVAVLQSKLVTGM